VQYRDPAIRWQCLFMPNGRERGAWQLRGGAGAGDFHATSSGERCCFSSTGLDLWHLTSLGTAVVTDVIIILSTVVVYYEGHNFVATGVIIGTVQTENKVLALHSPQSENTSKQT